MITANDINRAIELGIQDFFAESRRNIPSFIQKHYRYPGCWRTNKVAFGLDLLRAPINLIWAPIYVFVLVLALIANRVGFHRLGNILLKTPGGLTTNVQKHINALIQQELLNVDHLKASIESRLLQLEHIPKNIWEKRHNNAHQLSFILDDALKQLMQTRTATADITNTFFSTAIGALAFKKFTPGGIGIGILLTALWVKVRAKETFFLGSAIGGIYYSLFPPQASLTENAIGILLVMTVLAVIASFSGLITDPLQALLGLHRRRLMKLVSQIEKDLVDQQSSRFKTLDPYVARLMELFDTIRSQISI